jgi:ATP-dependent DNA helicase RecG
MATLSTKLSSLVGDKTADVLKTAYGFTTVEDLLRHYPRRYVVRGELTDISELRDGDETTILAEIKAVKLRRAPGKKILEVIVTDGSDEMSLAFFNQVWREKELRVGRTGLFAGKVGSFNGRKQLAHPDYELIPEGIEGQSLADEFAGKFIPVYPASGRMPTWKLTKCIDIVLDSLDEIPDDLPAELRQQFGYPNLREAFIHLHRPPSLEATERARERLTFNEALVLQLILAQRRNAVKALGATARTISDNGLVHAFEERLPFSFTEGQREINTIIENDLRSGHPMHRLLQGEVGSGKTVIALRAMLAVVDSGGQAALLAPTEVLANQHLRTLRNLLGPLAEAGTLQGENIGTEIVLLTGSLSAKERREALAKIANGDAGIVVGTHALIMDGVEFHDLGIVVVDEQHRFGVEQRDALRQKAKSAPHLLVMTATPIPRTVAMTIFGDLDISTLRQLPGGRSSITTHVIPVAEKPHYLDRAWIRIREEREKGHQAYVVAPRISLSEGGEGKGKKITDADREFARLIGEEFGEEILGEGSAVEELAPELALGPLKGLKVASLHGRQSTEEKDATMSAFARGEIDVLVATTVIEVGVDVPNATVMVIMDADRFGVSQLHQLRGRVGRGSAPGLCLLVSKAEEHSSARERLNAVASTVDGFELSRIDLEQRREGDVLGKMQSGTKSHLRLLRVLADEILISQARDVANQLLASDPTLTHFPELAREVEEIGQQERAEFMEKG